MAAIECDLHNREHLADVLFTRLANGETVGACEAGFVQFCQGIAALAADAEATAADDDALARLDGVTAPEAFPTPPTWSGGDDPEAELPSQPDSGPDDPEADQVTTPDDDGTTAAPAEPVARSNRKG